jgi:hypothetical protein
MLKTVLIMGGHGGVALFQKAWLESVVEEEKARMLSGVLAAFEEFSKQLAGAFVCHMEFGRVAASLVQDEDTALLCVLFYDANDGVRFGRLLASRILKTFLEEYAGEDFNRNVDALRYVGFTNRLHDAIRTAPVAVLHHLVRQSAFGIDKALLVYPDGSTERTGADDEIGLVANIKALAALSSSLHDGKAPQFISLEMERYTTCIHSIRDCYLVTVCSSERLSDTGSAPSSSAASSRQQDIGSNSYRHRLLAFLRDTVELLDRTLLLRQLYVTS